MGLLSAGYDLAMQHYKQQMQITKMYTLDSTKPIENKSPTTDLKPDNNFNNALDSATEKLDGSKKYNVGGYSITIPSLDNPTVKQRIKDMDLERIITEASKRYNVPEALIYKIIETESYFNNSSVSGAGATGLMQIMPGNFSFLGISNPHDPYQNIMGGVKLLSQYIDRYDGDIKMALAAYNAGPGNVDKYGGVPPFRETENYIRKILGVEP